MTIERLWSGWRLTAMEADRAVPEAGPRRRAGEGQTLFEAILASGLPDEETYVLWRGERVFSLLNLYPYTNGHLMVVPYRAVEALEDLDDAEHAELWSAVRDGVVAVRAAFSPQGVNVGLNQGEAAGPSIPEHLHVHVVPRWNADTNFMTAVANARVLPQPLDVSWRRLRDAWPDPAASRSGP